jgi:cytochrome c peroxidase
MGRYAEKPLGLMKGAFKTPTLRDITLTAPYFHDGSAATLDAVVSHYRQGGVAKTNLSPSMKSLTLTAKEEHAIVDFLTTLTSDHSNFQLPQLPPRKFVAGASE